MEDHVVTAEVAVNNPCLFASGDRAWQPFNQLVHIRIAAGERVFTVLPAPASELTLELVSGATGLGNSYGILGYILRAKIQVVPVTPYVALHTERFNDTKSLLDAMEAATHNPEVEYIESATYTKDELYLTTGKQVREVPRLLNIYGLTIFYKEISRPGDLYLRTEDYVFRYDPEWFWGLPEGPLYSLFRLLAPKSLRDSGFYKRQYAAAARVGLRVEVV